MQKKQKEPETRRPAPVLSVSQQQDQAQLAALFDHTPIPTLLVDAELRWRRANRAAIELCGQTPEWLLGLRPGEALACVQSRIAGGCGASSDCKLCGIRNTVLRTFQTNQACSRTEASLRVHGKKSQRYLRLLVSTAPIFVSGEKMVLLCLEDITELKRVEEEHAKLLEQEREARATAEAANRTKDEFLAIVSHELRTPLTAILGWTKMMRAGQLRADQRQRGLEVVERNTKALAAVVEDLLDVSRIISGKLRLDVHSIDLHHICEAAIEAISPAAEAKEIRVEWQLNVDAKVVRGDPARLQQIVFNLLSNAIKFTPKRGRVEVALSRNSSQYEILVKDSGIGISADFLPQLFERFRQADSSSTRMYRGLGLGLAISRHLAELHGGTIRAESPGEGRGASFIVSLPVAALRGDKHPVLATLEAHDSAAPASETLQGLRVLVVEDEADSRELLTLLLKGSGAIVAAAATVSDALVQISEFKPELLLSDIGLPGEDGYVLIRSVRNLPDEQGGSMPAIALTAYAHPEDRVRILRAGFQAHVAKPVDPIELLAIVSSISKVCR